MFEISANSPYVLQVTSTISQNLNEGHLKNIWDISVKFTKTVYEPIRIFP